MGPAQRPQFGMFEKLNMHGYLKTATFVLQTTMVFAIMVLSCLGNQNIIIAFSPAEAIDTWLHVG
jgi:hypothetical protein